MIAYKVVRKVGGKYYSYAAEGRAMVEYKIGKFVSIPPIWLLKGGYYLTAFETLMSAKEFVGRFTFDGNCVIFRVELKHCTQSLPNMLLLEFLKIGKFETNDWGQWPRKTIMAREIRLLKEVAWK